ncbi:MAG: hypothetical protein AMXMBFR74_25030 [Parvibaculum sp.]|jgi:hypothetical protein|uniref:hypothetical protein n=1 Tax=Parvibaculum sp. TaxID=2024848 RepID=UPI0035B923B3
MSIPSRYLDRDTAISLLAARGFNHLDIECVLDLTGPVHRQGAPVWPASAVERLAARAWWLHKDEIGLAMAQAA